MKIHEVSTNYITGKTKVRRQQNLTSFGTSHPTPTEQPKCDDKKANEAIKSNFLANVSFGGHTKHINVSRYDSHNYSTERKPVFEQGTSGRIVRYETKSIPTSIKSTEYAADGYRSSDVDIVLRRAITMSDDYEGGTIEKSGNFVISPNYNSGAPNSASAKVYFADKDEGVYKDIIREHDYIVYASGSYKSDYENYGDEIQSLSYDPGEFYPPGGSWSYT